MHEHLIDSVGSDDKPLISDLTATHFKKDTVTNYNSTFTTTTTKTHNRDHPRKAGKYVQGLSGELEPRSYLLNVNNESSKKEFQTENLVL